MNIAQNFLAELKQEAIATRKILSVMPFDNPSWKPHEKSMEIAHLASHVAEMYDWMDYTINMDVLDFSKIDYKPDIPASTEALLRKFEDNLAKAEKALENCTDEKMMQNWTMRNGEQIYFTLPRAQVVRSMVMNHIVHHRAQLGVYLRLRGVALPPVYGPTADDPSGM